MKRSEPTPGPWRAEPYKGDGDPCYGILAYERHSNLTREVAMVEHWSRGTAKANAELIAKAPELAEFVGMIARMSDPEEGTTEDALSTLGRLIEDAKELSREKR